VKDGIMHSLHNNAVTVYLSGVDIFSAIHDEMRLS